MTSQEPRLLHRYSQEKQGTRRELAAGRSGVEPVPRAAALLHCRTGRLFPRDARGRIGCDMICEVLDLHLDQHAQALALFHPGKGPQHEYDPGPVCVDLLPNVTGQINDAAEQLPLGETLAE